MLCSISWKMGSFNGQTLNPTCGLEANLWVLTHVSLDPPCWQRLHSSILVFGWRVAIGGPWKDFKTHSGLSIIIEWIKVYHKSFSNFWGWLSLVCFYLLCLFLLLVWGAGCIQNHHWRRATIIIWLLEGGLNREVIIRESAIITGFTVCKGSRAVLYQPCLAECLCGTGSPLVVHDLTITCESSMHHSVQAQDL